MTDAHDDDTYDGEDDGQDERYVQLKRNEIRALERDAKQARKASEENAQLKRDLAFARAGIGDLSERQQKALFATIDGEITAESVRAAAEELNFVQSAQTAAPEPDPDAAALNRMSQASAGATDPSSEDSVARLDRVAREGGRDALLAQIRADGHQIVTSG